MDCCRYYGSLGSTNDDWNFISSFSFLLGARPCPRNRCFELIGSMAGIIQCIRFGFRFVLDQNLDFQTVQTLMVHALLRFWFEHFFWYIWLLNGHLRFSESASIEVLEATTKIQSPTIVIAGWRFVVVTEEVPACFEHFFSIVAHLYALQNNFFYWFWD